MLDINFIRNNKEVVQAGADKKHVDIDIGELISLDDKRREMLQSVEAKRAKQNDYSDQIANASNSEERMFLIRDSKEVKEELKKEEADLKEVMNEWQKMMLRVPNVPDMSVPEGSSDEENEELRQWGSKPEFDFKTKSHVELMTDLEMADFECGVKVSGFRGYFLKNAGAKLESALWRYAEDQLLGDDWTLMRAPSLVRKAPFVGTGFLPQFEEDIYRTQDDEYFAGTAEVPVMGYFQDEVLEVSDLPIKILAFSPCFRREAGSHGKDTGGLMRVHEFYKVERVILCEASHESSVEHHEALQESAEKLMQGIGLPYRVVLNCGGDLGLGQVKKYDIEAWIPSEGKYRETHSCSYFHDFQTRRLNIKYRDAGGETRYAHSLNATAFATPRTLIPLIENNQQEDGSIVVPESLRDYVGTDVVKKGGEEINTSTAN